MKLGYNTKAKDPTYYIQVGVRNGNKVTTKKVHTIGKHSELLKITDDPLTYAKEQVAKFNEEAAHSKIDMEVNIKLGEKIQATSNPASATLLKNVGYLYLQKIYNEMDISSFFKSVTEDRKITFDPDIVNRFLTYSRILDPDSKLGTLEKIHNFYGNQDFAYQHILRTMDLMADNYNSYIEHLFRGSEKITKRNTSVCYYDCTNYYCESESPDPDYTDPVTGEILPGLRKYGISKENRPNPIVQMGLFMDTDGIPVSMCINPGNTNEQVTAIPLEKDMLKMFNGKKFIYCADSGIGSYHIRNFNSMGGRAFVITQSIKKLSDKLQEAVFNDYDYCLLSNNKPISIEKLKSFDIKDPENLDLYNDRAYKVIEANTLYDVGLYEEKLLKNGTIKKVKSKACLKQYVIITFSRKAMEYQRHIRKQQVERAKKIIEKMDPDEYKKGPNDVTRFIKKKEKSSDEFVLDEEKIAKEEKYDGYYAIATNLDDDVSEIVKINEQRYKIEDCFRLLKTDFVSRPIYHRNRNRIIAHFMICYTALLIFRLIENRLNKFDKSVHLTPRNIIETMQNMEVANIEDTIYAAQYSGSTALTVLEACLDMGLNYKYFKPKELNEKCRKKFKGMSVKD